MVVIEKSNYIKIYLLVLVVFFISGCIGGSQSALENADDWQDDVLLASECGMDGLRCCVDQDPECKFGQTCCTDPNNPKRNYCADDCACGELNRFCCENNECGLGMVCDKGYCGSCGGDAEFCCDSEKPCGEELICHLGTCKQCGLANSPCCFDSPACLTQDLEDNTRTECQNNICRTCGASGNQSCQGEPACNLGHLLNNKLCLPCGNLNQPCCSRNANTPNSCNAEADLECTRGFCSEPNN